MAAELTAQQVLRTWLLTILGERGGSVPTARALTEMERRYGKLLSEEDQSLTRRGDESKWWNRTRFERKDMERAKLLIPASESRGVWTLTEAGWEEYRKIERAEEVEVALPVPIQPVGQESPSRAEVTTQRVVRSTAVADYVKQIHDYICQICGTRLITPKGAYAEAAHIRALGQPHFGPDVAANVLCLCPNHHVLFDFGALVISDILIVTDQRSGASLGRLREAPGHEMGRDFLTYHRMCNARVVEPQV
ncbi:MULTISPECIES: HNH endonuclease [Streptomyces]|uniref:HNH endonuclease n=1 Tax=Streptomyces TaxID=1883 RepID=UPI001EFB3D31|nr:HNH endonuclease [Streptomyces sp. OspMP-M43]